LRNIQREETLKEIKVADCWCNDWK